MSARSHALPSGTLSPHLRSHVAPPLAHEGHDAESPPTVKPASVAAASGSGQSKPSKWKQLASALFYAITSLVITSANKIVLTSHGFPSSSFLAMSQFAITCVALKTCEFLGYIKLAPLSVGTFRQIAPITALFLVDVLCGLAGTKFISLPMFAVLRRFSIPMTMLLEKFRGQSNPTFYIQSSVWGMVIGAVIAAVDDLAFNFIGYLFVFTNNFATAARGVYIKSLTTEQRTSKMDLLYYNALFSLVVMLFLLPMIEDVGACINTELWNSPSFLLHFLFASGLGPVLQYSIYLCTQFNSALTTTVVGCIKNAAVVYIGFVIGGDYVYSLWNFIGINLSIVASVVYVHATFSRS
uniref:Sugar phosphate transporter domain-containing protein n=1 Tax=Phaeomonas parva TaxID=124430 RepID=A0A7S1UKG6_9STRA|mmetsp:Transcript_9900/g.29105  ORF Transcript_9900/g.29105 Transcript_9900/m.29105 type:complete len:353 (-) Transcript_9900:249-1307(-)|eukprot:CAMPEP_0118850416 /NCGR_PEP_ID=MMETSP1163-20130328/286_1 /TAXON_ID=124430 /ORGANISM="Phaeomonas parva, Strain CCMP2877" /LENGTH=352 /DNA_ID=CAMNT_0006782627 /DNA_START=175 /DNA_END=1233 /DNA_ORIENTATION=-